MKLKKLLIALAALPLVACGGKGAANNNGSSGNGGSSGGDGPSVVNIVWGEVYSEDTNLTSYSKSGVSFTFARGTGQNDPVYKQNGLDARLYANNTMTISASSNISKIEIVLNDFDTSKNGTMTANVGSLSGAGSDSYLATWTGNNSSIKFTVTEKQKRMLSVSITLGGTVSGGETGGETGGENETVHSLAEVVADYADILGFALEYDSEYDEYWTYFSLEDTTENDIEEACEYAVAISPEYLLIASDVAADTWDDDSAGYFATLCNEDGTVWVNIGTWGESGVSVVQIEVYEYTF